MNELEQLLHDLVAINSINPDLVPGAPGEATIAEHIARWMAAAGLEVIVEEVLPGRPNVIGIARGSGSGRTLLLNGHVDTVGVTGMDKPFQPRVEGGRMYGRGAYDMKGGLAACMMAAAQAKRHNLRGDVIVTAVADEEYAGLGTIAIAERYRADGAIVAEPTELDLVVAHKGFIWFDIETIGVAAHGSRPHLGVDAIAKMGRFLVELENLGHSLAARTPHPLLGTPSIHASIIQGGQEMSSYPDRCVLSVERRTLPGESAAEMEAELQAIIAAIGETDPTFVATARQGLQRLPLETPADAAVLLSIQKAAELVTNKPLVPAGVSFWTDAASLCQAGIPTVLFGPLGAGAHAAEEWVDLGSVNQCAEVYLQTALDFCR